MRPHVAGVVGLINTLAATKSQRQRQLVPMRSVGSVDQTVFKAPSDLSLPVHIALRLLPWMKEDTFIAKNLGCLGTGPSLAKDDLKTLISKVPWIFDVWFCHLLDSANHIWIDRAHLDEVINENLRKIRFWNSVSHRDCWAAVIPILRSQQKLNEIIFDLRDEPSFSIRVPYLERWEGPESEFPSATIKANQNLKDILELVKGDLSETTVKVVGESEEDAAWEMCSILNISLLTFLAFEINSGDVSDTQYVKRICDLRKLVLKESQCRSPT